MVKRLFGVLVVVAATMGVLLGAQTAAQAETKNYNWVQQDTSTGNCKAIVYTYIDSDNDKKYAWGSFENYQAGWSCIGWLERSVNGGSWYMVSDRHTVLSLWGMTKKGATGGYYDGPDYRARACFKFSFSGAATHCTNAYGG
jgi:hypothetical protein